ncbi:uncharacterized protein PHALS_14077 [Plasmopara halstedii]|uniref:Uncharacterized protein n=1 Tax=Plasmopara halstedii TaxID=4781 RepID=A0A0P1AR10_PLAHL|nr:uncharacterized protein PHALS_14077 [Plasmopara halstedii]CEG43785.1 hypothetical protein PHALS_14077 [Plasmopara halstedii]|eukprot:XP_024580154.1 hypothetical protein PHALS_14077 [Plasmopara halstedii]
MEGGSKKIYDTGRREYGQNSNGVTSRRVCSYQPGSSEHKCAPPCNNSVNQA